MTTAAFLLGAFKIDSANSSLLKRAGFLDAMLIQSGIQAEWLDEVIWLDGRGSPGEREKADDGVPTRCWDHQPGLDFFVLSAAVDKISCAHGHMIALAEQTDGCTCGCVLVSPAAAGRFNLLPVGELLTVYLDRHKNTESQPAWQLSEVLEKAGFPLQEATSLLLSSKEQSQKSDFDPGYIISEKTQVVPYTKTSLLQYLAQVTEAYSSPEDRFDIMLTTSTDCIKDLVVLKKV